MVVEVFLEYVLGTTLRFVAGEFTKVARYKQQLRPLCDIYHKHAELLRELESDTTTKKSKQRAGSLRFQEWSRDCNLWCARTEAVIEEARRGARVYQPLKRRSIWLAIQTQMQSFSELRNDLPVATISCLVVEQQINDGYRRQKLPDNFVQPDDRKLAKLIRLLKNKDGPKWIGICGMGGSGKSVLASMVNNDMSVLEHFEGRVYFLTAHRNAVVRDLLVTLCHLLNFHLVMHHMNEAEEQLKSMLHDALDEQRTLLILDDVWERSVLDGLDVLTRENGSKVLVTSRNSGLLEQLKGEILSSRGLLSASSNSELFSMHAFKDEESMHRPELTALVDEMAAACKGLPLALKVVGSSMVGKEDRQSWKTSADKVKAKGVSVLELEDKQFSHLFEFSYEELLTLKDGKLFQECYLCMAAFESGARITLEEILALWRGDDLLPSLAVEEGEVCGWQEARWVLDVLVKRSLVEVESGEDGDTYRLHDVLRDLILDRLDRPEEEHEKGCIFLAGRAKGKKLTDLFSSRGNNLQAAARVSLRASEIDSLPESKVEASGVRVLLLDRNTLAAGLHSSIIKSFANLKVLSMRETGLKTLPVDICILQQLQVLDLKDSMLEVFPECCYEGLSSLVYLDLSSRNVKDFQFGKLKKLNNLEVLRLTFTSHREEVLDLDALPKLVSLELRSNEKSQGSVQICSSGTTKLANLRHFALHSKVANFRKLSSFPVSLESCVVRVGTMHGSWKTMFQGCTSLAQLDVGSLLDNIPAAENFPVMTSFTLRGCSVIPTSLTRSLTSLVFWDCTFQELPEFKLELLEKLEFHSCLSLFHLPQSVTRLPKLRELRVTNGGLTKALLRDVPRKEQDSKDTLHDIPFRELRVLDLEGTRITYLPSEVARSPKLESLVVSNCDDLEKIVEPEEGAAHEEDTFTSLLELNFSNTKLSFDLLPSKLRSKNNLKTIC